MRPAHDCRRSWRDTLADENDVLFDDDAIDETRVDGHHEEAETVAYDGPALDALMKSGAVRAIGQQDSRPSVAQYIAQVAQVAPRMRQAHPSSSVYIAPSVYVTPPSYAPPPYAPPSYAPPSYAPPSYAPPSYAPPQPPRHAYPDAVSSVSIAPVAYTPDSDLAVDHVADRDLFRRPASRVRTFGIIGAVAIAVGIVLGLSVSDLAAEELAPHAAARQAPRETRGLVVITPASAPAKRQRMMMMTNNAATAAAPALAPAPPPSPRASRRAAGSGTTAAPSTGRTDDAAGDEALLRAARSERPL